jgi:putative endopeptidase
MRRHSLFLTLGLLGTALVAAGPAAADRAKPAHGIDPTAMDLSVKPCDDFYQYANGTWLKNNPIPPEESIWGGFNEVRDLTRETLKGILEETSAKTTWAPGSIRQKVGDFYATGMDEAAIEKAGTRPVQPALKLVDGITQAKGLPALLAVLHNMGLGGGFGFHVAQDAKNSTQYLGALNQGGLGLPDRDYYTKTDAKSVALREGYVKHLTRMFELVGDAPAVAGRNAATVLALETRLAKACLTRVEQRDPQKTYHKMSLAELATEAPGFDWGGYFKARGVKSLAEVNVRQPGFFKEFAVLSRAVPVADWKTYCRWHVLRSTANTLPKAFADENFNFYEKTLNGIPQQSARWKRIQAATDGSLGEALGQLYVEKAFPPEAKAKVLDLVENLRSALKERIEKLDWMTEPTRKAALTKLGAFGVKIGYTDKWKDYSTLKIDRQSYAGNVLRARTFEVKRNLAKLGKPLDRTEWGMSPQTVNAYYSPTMNEIVFPAAILQAPFFDPKADDACNYGGIGMVIGHEMTHGFDDSGSQYDAQGNLKNWWQDSDRAAYKSRTDLVVKQFDAYKALPDQSVNGKLTLGENIADLGGLKIAFAAWKKSLAGKPAPAAIDGFTGEQRFFLNLACVWRNNIREEALRVRLNTDPHSPGKYRVLGPLSNLPEFYEAFGCPEGSAMVRPLAERPTIW